ncbi:hypothetical protein [Kribbella sp. NPDC050470]|uniref:hypothetical protein n=1 Tax=unclassified Kribbella TaxID=2644121 RepID=UPI0037A36AE1
MNDVRPGGPVPYREVSEPGYAEQAAETFVIETFGVGMSLLGGVCPRCQAAIEVPLVDGVFRALSATERAEGGHHAVPVICTCSETHPGRPDDRVGCGAYWIFNLPANA